MSGTNETMIGEVEAYREDVEAAKISLESGDLSVGDTIHIRGNTSEAEAIVDAMQGPEGPKQEAKPGETVGIKVDTAVEEGADVFKVTDPYGDEQAKMIDEVMAEE